MARKAYDSSEFAADDVPGAGGDEAPERSVEETRPELEEPSQHAENDRGEGDRDRDDKGRFVPKKPSPHDSRQALFDAMKRRRDGADEPTATPDDEQRDPEPETKAQAEAKKFRLRVNHQDREVTEEELIAAAQKGLAWDSKPDDLQRMQQELARLREIVQSQTTGNGAQPHQGTAQPAAQQGGQPATRPNGLDPEALKNAVRTIQLEDEDKGAEALQQVIEAAMASVQQQNPNADPHAVVAMVQQQLRDQELREQAAQSFADAHPAIVQDEDYFVATLRNLHGRFVEDLQRIGLSPQQLQPAMTNYQIAVDWHRELRAKVDPRTGLPYQLTDPTQLADAAAQAIEEKFNLSGPAQPKAQPARPSKVEEKRNLAASQPRRTSAVARTPGVKPKPSVDEVVNKMRLQRGQAVI